MQRNAPINEGQLIGDILKDQAERSYQPVPGMPSAVGDSISRPNSAPPTERAQENSLFGVDMSTISPEDPRLDPKYYFYYHAHRSLNPRLPAPLPRQPAPWPKSPAAAFYPPSRGGVQVPLPRQEGSMAPSTPNKSPLSEFEAAVAAAGGSTPRGTTKSLIDRIQEDFPRTPSPVYASRRAAAAAAAAAAASAPAAEPSPASQASRDESSSVDTVTLDMAAAVASMSLASKNSDPLSRPAAVRTAPSTPARSLSPPPSASPWGNSGILENAAASAADSLANSSSDAISSTSEPWPNTGAPRGGTPAQPAWQQNSANFAYHQQHHFSEYSRGQFSRYDGQSDHGPRRWYSPHPEEFVRPPLPPPPLPPSHAIQDPSAAAAAAAAATPLPPTFPYRRGGSQPAQFAAGPPPDYYRDYYFEYGYYMAQRELQQQQWQQQHGSGASIPRHPSSGRWHGPRREGYFGAQSAPSPPLPPPPLSEAEFPPHESRQQRAPVSSGHAIYDSMDSKMRRVQQTPTQLRDSRDPEFRTQPAYLQHQHQQHRHPYPKSPANWDAPRRPISRASPRVENSRAVTSSLQQPAPSLGSVVVSQGRSALLEAFRSGTKGSGVAGAGMELPAIAGHVVEFSRDQHGSRFIQQRLEVASAAAKQAVFEEALQSAIELMTDVFGNYVIQKFLDHGSVEQQRQLAAVMNGKVLALSLQMYGCRVVQKALEVLPAVGQRTLVEELRGHVLHCVQDQNGNHVIQKCIEKVRGPGVDFIVAAFTGQVPHLATHPYGCRVIQRVLEHCPPAVTGPVLEEIHGCCASLVADQYGNYVVQHVLDHGHPAARASLVATVVSHILQFSQHKFASNVVEKCVACSSPAERRMLVDAMLKVPESAASAEGQIPGPPIDTMMKDPYANYVVQKVMDTAPPKQLQRILARIRAQSTNLKRFTYGKHILSRYDKITQQLNVQHGNGGGRAGRHSGWR